MTNQTITVGTWVAFAAKGQEFAGTVTKVTSKNVIIDAGVPGRYWRIPKRLLITGRTEAEAREKLTASLSEKTFHPGQFVEWKGKDGTTRTGTVTRIGKSNVTVHLPTGEGWRVNPMFLSPLA